METVTGTKLDDYEEITEEALAMAKANVTGDADEIIDMVERYVSDAKHFREEGQKVTAFGALNYAHGWLDCGARLGYFDVDDDRLFTVEPNS
jgi:hypothetical protein